MDADQLGEAANREQAAAAIGLDVGCPCGQEAGVT
jgi:hypothetical protein